MKNKLNLMFYGLLLAGGSSVLFLSGLNNLTSFFGVIIIVVFAYLIPLVFLIYSIYLVSVDRTKYSPQLIIVGTYFVLFTSFVLMLVLWNIVPE